MGMAGRVRLGEGALGALPAASDWELDLDGQGLPIAVAFETADDREGNADGEDGFGLYQDLADAIALDGGLDDVDVD